MSKKIVATTSLAGCFGCHMSVLDIDTRIVDLIQLVEFNKSPINDIKKFTKRADIGIIEGGVCNNENYETLKLFRENCDILISLGECAIMGGLPAMRNNIPLAECLNEAFHNAITAVPGKTLIPHHEDIPKILDRVYPCHELVKIDFHIPGCPPPADLIWDLLAALVTGKTPTVRYETFKFD